jgi:hypothetical protein
LLLLIVIKFKTKEAPLFMFGILKIYYDDLLILFANFWHNRKILEVTLSLNPPFTPYLLFQLQTLLFPKRRNFIES